MISIDLARFQKCRVLVIGDVMLDSFIRGNVRRISPEAPVPVVEVIDETLNPGGAANVACNISPFSEHVYLLGRVGQDAQASDLRQLLTDQGVDSDLMLVNASIPTISKARIVARQQQIVRVDREKLQWLSDSEVEEIVQRVERLAPDLDAIIIEDYGKGLITEALVHRLSAVTAQHRVIITVDPSPRNNLQWQGVYLVKPNRLEAFSAAGIEDSHLALPPLQNPELLQVGQKLLQQWGTEMVLVTLGEQGMMLFRHHQPPHHIPTRAREVYDVSGAGDTAIALLTLALAAGYSATEAADIANIASGIVVGKLGTACISPDELNAAMNDNHSEY